MGKTVPSYRMAIEDEIRRWKPFVDCLSEPDKAAFEELMDMCRANAMAGSNACKPILFEPMVVSMLLGQQKRIIALERDYPDIYDELYEGRDIPKLLYDLKKNIE